MRVVRLVSTFFVAITYCLFFFHISCGLFNIYLPQRMLVKLNSSLVKFCGILSFTGPYHHKFIMFVALLPSSYV